MTTSDRPNLPQAPVSAVARAVVVDPRESPIKVGAVLGLAGRKCR